MSFEEVLVDLEMLALIYESENKDKKAEAIRNAIQYLKTRKAQHDLFASVASTGV